MKYFKRKDDKSTKRNLFAIIVLFLVTSNQLACSQPKEPDQQSKFDHGILWSIQHPETQKTSYLIGTIHSMDTNFIKLPLDQLQKLFLTTDVLCLESILPNENESVKKALDQILLKDTIQNIMNTLDKESKEKLLNILRSSNDQVKVMEVMLSRIEPAILIFMLTSERQRRSSFFKDNNFMPEGHFTRYANENNIQIKGLEKSGEVLNSLKSDEQSFSQIIDVLKMSIEEFDKPDHRDIYKNYLRQELDLIPKSIVEDPSFVQRNKTMATSIDSLIQHHKLFVMVGAAHLSKEQGVLNLLHKKGYIVNNIELKLNE